MGSTCATEDNEVPEYQSKKYERRQSSQVDDKSEVPPPPAKTTNSHNPSRRHSKRFLPEKDDEAETEIELLTEEQEKQQLERILEKRRNSKRLCSLAPSDSLDHYNALIARDVPIEDSEEYYDSTKVEIIQRSESNCSSTRSALRQHSFSSNMSSLSKIDGMSGSESESEPDLDIGSQHSMSSPNSRPFRSRNVSFRGQVGAMLRPQRKVTEW